MTALAFQRIHAQLARYETIGYVPFGRTGFSGSAQGDTAQVGQGDDFHSFGRYRDGDDIRLVDWASYARTGKLWSRHFTTNRTKKLYLALDGSGSMGVNQGQKWQASIECALLLHAMTVQAGYEAEVLVVGGRGIERVPTGTDGSITQESFDWLAHCVCEGPTLISSLHALEIGTGGELCVLSDFMWADVLTDLNLLAHLLPLEMSLIRVSALADIQTPLRPYRDPETGGVGSVLGRQVKATQQRLDDFREGLIKWSTAHEKLFFDWGDDGHKTAMQCWLDVRHRHSMSVGAI